MFSLYTMCKMQLLDFFFNLAIYIALLIEFCTSTFLLGFA